LFTNALNILNLPIVIDHNGFLKQIKIKFQAPKLTSFKQPTIIDDNEIFKIIIYFQSALIFHKIHI
jgi:hypothetical protein